MARSKSWVRIQAEYYPVSFLIRLVRLLPMGVGETLFYYTLRLVLVFIPRRFRLMRDHLRQSFPEMTPAQVDETACQSLRYLARGMTVFTRLPEIAATLSPEWVTCKGAEHVEEGLRRGKGVLFFGAHFGFWELQATYLMRCFPRGAAAARPLDNPRIEKLVAGIRSHGEGRFIPKNELLRGGLRHLKQNGLLGILIDQNFAPGGLFVPFFGRLASTTSIVSILARRTGAIVLPTRTRWEGRRGDVIIDPPLELSSDPDTSKAVAVDTARMTAIIERWIREDPAQWLWLHNRWKRRPLPGETQVSESMDVSETQ